MAPIIHCARCGAPVTLRTSQQTGRRYYVNADDPGRTGPIGQFHSPTCPAQRKRPDPRADVPVTTPAPAPSADLAAIIAAHIYTLLPAISDESKMREIAQDVIANSPTRALVVSVRGSTIPPFNAGRQHAQFPLLVSIIARRRNIWLAGPAGSGKTSAAHAAARALSLAFGSISVGPQTTQSALFGYMDAHGNYIPTEFRRRFEQGGVFLIDEIDRGNPGVLTALNQAIENGTCAFPDAMIPRHPDFITVAAANTYGTGASREYVGALQLDAATLDRFVMLHWDYDEALETDIARATFTASGGTDSTIISRWLLKVRYARQRATALSIRHIVSPRASIVGADLLGSGLPESTVAPLVLWKGLDSDTIARLSRDSDD